MSIYVFGDSDNERLEGRQITGNLIIFGNGKGDSVRGHLEVSNNLIIFGNGNFDLLIVVL